MVIKPGGAGQDVWHSIIKPVTDRIISLELAPALQALPRWRLERALSYRFDRDRYTCAKSYLLLKELLSSHYGMTDDVQFVYGRYGKPFLKGFTDIYFSMSHCPKAVFCAVGDAPVGVDVEEIQYDEAVAREVFSDSEFCQIRSSESPEVRFTELWTQKEAYLKLTGTGMNDDLKNVLSASVISGVKFETEADAAGGIVRTTAYYRLESFDFFI